MSKTEILKDSLDLLNEKRTLFSQMKEAFNSCAETYSIDKNICNRVKDYYHYKGNKCDPSDILTIDKESDEKFPDRVAPCFRKLLQVITDLAAVDDLEFLDEYLDSLKNKGITIIINQNIKDTKNSQSDKIKETIKDIDTQYQDQICSIADELRDKKSNEAEQNGLCKKKNFKTALNIYDKHIAKKDISDKIITIQNNHSDLEKVINEINTGNYG